VGIATAYRQGKLAPARSQAADFAGPAGHAPPERPGIAVAQSGQEDEPMMTFGLTTGVPMTLAIPGLKSLPLFLGVIGLLATAVLGFVVARAAAAQPRTPTPIPTATPVPAAPVFSNAA
jgi:hypothetical protein